MGGKRKNAAAARGVSPTPSATSTTPSATVTTKVQPKDSAPPIATTTNAFATSTQIEPTTTTTTTSTTKASGTTSKSSSSSNIDKTAAAAAAGGQQAWNKVFSNLLRHYQDTTPQRTKLLDAFMAFLVVVGGLQFLYCVLAGNYPFNAFLSGFSATVGQFVLTASLRIQTTEANKSDFPSVSPERAFADYLVCSLILHFFCVNFIN
ncbi:DAD-domain-containing protein [Neurospora crassa]|uniref:Dolichyl-diphosphooligosaccharide--protein glycosyltransferase subunit OST2 n=1 Tax=Neurospora crassa (strain ATCC 24698 / 74-OR23-1A / CBS 708.71 / DSM 1257 / FGSC 987) TaxID=367110 RepID=Q1K6C9_NEUCR|nr:oligosaccharyl transferase epsilon subunit [Neurospora crassa OR74A]EAA29924.2 oligosaccharyl transferase epsilon subunit [Neurospora crassa OR74A]KHE88405.1 DAD-domain-containing protein [Neurospora crassa]|eukprot:XP_959160.2 oligosaccharyl transferase epsilon subunit [Neurospora crassa OR74A]